MDSAFNPYLKWLGIPLKDQPPSHYRLLGLEPFETDDDIIERAADRQMTYVRQMQTGEHSAVAQDLLNELSLAKVCLLDADRRAEYDHQLKRATQEVALPVAKPLGAEPLKAEPLVAEPLTAEPLMKAVAPPAHRPGQRTSDSNIGSASSSGVLKHAVPLGVAPVAVAAGATDSFKPSPVGISGTKQEKPRSSILPWILAATIPVAVFALGFLAFLILDRTDESLDTTGGTSVAAQDIENQQPSDVGPDKGVPTDGANDTDDEDITNGNENVGNVNPGNNGDVNVGGNTPSVGGNPPPPSRTPTAEVFLDAPFLTGTLVADNPVLSDRDYTFAQVDSELEGLQFTRWKYGPVRAMDLELTQPGRVYLILPPEQYSRPLPNVTLSGWTKSDLTCTVRTESGIIRPCLVFYRDGAKDSLSISRSSVVWPLLAAKSVNRKGRTLDEVVNNPETPSPTDPTAPGPGPVDPSGEPPDPDLGAPKLAKRAVPTNAAQQPIRERITEIFELDTLETVEEKVAAAKRMLQVGRDSSEDATECFVILATAARLSADTGDLATALRAVEEIDKRYDSKTAAMQLYLVQQFANARLPKQQKEAQLRYVVPVLDQGLANDQFESVDKTVTELFENGLSHKELGERRRIARELKVKYRVVALAKQTLSQKPDDGAANTVVGEYLCYQKLDWEAGLPLLAKSDVPQLRELAQLDLDGSPDADSQLKVGDGWFKIAEEQESELARGGLLTRAEDWYRKALPQVNGLTAAHASKRLDEIRSQLVDLGWVNIPKKAVIYAASGTNCEMYLNGESLFNVSYRVGQANVTLKRGDIITVRASRRVGTTSFGYGRGFACVITFEGSSTPVVTARTDEWEAYVPSDATFWYKPENVARTVPHLASLNAGHTELRTQSGVAARSIWYSGGDTSEAYFLFKVK